MKPQTDGSVDMVENAGLTVRERQVLELVDTGLGDEEIAKRLRIARSTVDTLLRSSMTKLRVRTRREAVTRIAEIPGP